MASAVVALMTAAAPAAAQPASTVQPRSAPTAGAPSGTAAGTATPPSTAAALAAVKAADAAIDAASDRLGQALDEQRRGQAAAAAAAAAASAAQAAADARQGSLDAYAHWLYTHGPMAGASPLVQSVLGASSPADAQASLADLRAVGELRSQQVRQALAAQDSARQAQGAAATAATAAARALAAAVDAKSRLVTVATQARTVLALARARDAALQRAAYAQTGGSGDGPAAAAADLMAQAVATGAATPRTFAGLPDDAARIAVADAALLAQVAGHVRAPAPAQTAAPGSDARIRAVMGPLVAPTPTNPPVRTPKPVASVALVPAGSAIPGLGSPGVGLTGLSASGLMAASPQPLNGVTVAPVVPDPTGMRANAAAMAVAEALRQVGKPYVWAASGPDTFDCSGLALWAWGKAGVRLPHSSSVQWNLGTPVNDPTLLLPGDLVLFGTGSAAGIHHVGIYLGAGFMVAAPRSGEYVQVQRVGDLSDFAGGVRL